MDQSFIICSEDSRVLRLFNDRRYVDRVLTNHNDIITCLLKFKNKPILITASSDGAIKCMYG